jgi:heterotetrameric sarcosine oxidase gamma subunit
VAELAAQDPLDGLGLPLAAGGSRLAALPAVRRVAVAPFAGRHAEVAAALGTALPAVGATAALAGGHLLWAGDDVWLVEGVAAPDLAGLAAVVEQSDAWAGLVLEGAAARDVLARLVPLDLDPSACPAGSAARTLLRQVPLLIVVTADGFRLLVPRSFAASAVEDLARAMRGVAARPA